MDHGDLCQSFLEKDVKDVNSTNFWQCCVKQGHLSSGTLVAEQGLCVVKGGRFEHEM